MTKKSNQNFLRMKIEEFLGKGKIGKLFHSLKNFSLYEPPRTLGNFWTIEYILL